MKSTIYELPAIDVHGHYGLCIGSEVHPLKKQFMSGDPATVATRAKASHVRYTVVSPLAAIYPHGRADVAAGNEAACLAVEQTDGLLQWAVLNPLQPVTFEQTRRMLERPKRVGIKIHPEEHCYPIAEHGRTIFEFAAELRAVILAHSGQPNSLPADFVSLANDFPEVTLILAHLGNSDATADSPALQVQAIQAATRGNVYADTSSAQSLLPGLIEWAVGEVGPERLLFGTDTPLYFAASQRARIEHADLIDQQKRLILYDNARRILPIPDSDGEQTRKDSNKCWPLTTHLAIKEAALNYLMVESR
jgi:uncharacterized protein